jgi:heme-degrading monooxygenase HmoA
MIARIWHGITMASDADAYTNYLNQTGLPDYRATEGNQGVTVLRRIEGDVAHFTLISYWESFEAIRKFAGDDIEVARYYPEDKAFLLEFEPHVTHHEVLAR